LGWNFSQAGGCRWTTSAKDVATARKVGARRGKPVILTVEAGRMHHDGYKFLLSVNGVWLTESVPPGYLSML
jgi:putative RNA 2'-phosphotransferase